MRLALLVIIAVGVAIGASMPAPVPPAMPAPISVEPAASPAVTAPPVPPGATVLEREANGHFYATVAVNGAPILFLVDTGASVMALAADDARRANVAFDPGRFTVVGRGASGEVRGQQVTIGRVALGGRESTAVPGVVIEGSEVSLLGQSFLRGLDVAISGDRMTLR